MRDATAPVFALAVFGLISLVLSIFGPILALDTPTQPTQPHVVCPSVREAVEATVAAHARETASAYGTRDAAWADRAATQDARREP